MSSKIEHLPVTKCFEITTGKLNSNAAKEGGQYPFFTCAKELFHIDTFAFDQEALLLAGNNAQGEYDVKHYSGKFNAYQRTYVLTLANSSNSYNYFKYALQAQLERLKSNSKGTNTKYITMEILERTLLPVPTPEEQKRIAAILDKADAIRRKRQQAIDLADDFLRSVFLDMFGDPVTNPKGWEINQVGKIVDCIVPGRDKPKSFTGQMPWITTNDLNHLGTTCVSEKSMGLSDEEINAVKARIIPQGSVLMTCVGDLGIVSLAGNDMVMNQQLHAFIPNELIEKEFLLYALSFQKHYMIKMASSTTVPYMNKTVCNSVPIILPPVQKQREFAAIYKSSCGIKDKLNLTEHTKDTLFSSLSQKAFTGKL